MKLTLNKINYTIVILALIFMCMGCGNDRTEHLPTDDMLHATPSIYDLSNPNMPTYVFIEFAPFDGQGNPYDGATGVFELNTDANSVLVLGDDSGNMVGFDLEDEGVAEAWLYPSTTPELVTIYAYAAVYPYDIQASIQVRIIDSSLLRADFTSRVDSTNTLLVHFADESSTGGAVLTYSWDFDNDGVADSTVQNPNYAFPAAGYYYVSLTVNNGVTTDTRGDVLIYVE